MEDDLNGFADVVELEGEDYHVAGVSEGGDAWIDYSCPVDDVPRCQRSGVNVLMLQEAEDVGELMEKMAEYDIGEDDVYE